MSNKSRVVHGSRQKPQEFAGNRKRFDAKDFPEHAFGKYGQLTPKAIRQANLSKEEEDLAWEMLHVQSAFLEIYHCMSYPVDPEGHVHDLSAIGPTKLAIAWTLALNGFRSSGPKYIKKRAVASAGCYTDAHTWVDIRKPDTAVEELRTEHRSADYTLPPDTRKLAAQRDGDPGQQYPSGWDVTPEVSVEFAPRPDAPPQGNSP